MLFDAMLFDCACVGSAVVFAGCFSLACARFLVLSRVILFGRVQDIQKAIADSGAAEIIAKLPEGLETEMSSTFSNLSVGQRQRLVIARAFLRNAPLLLLDEPTSALDVRSEELVTQAISRLRLGRTCIMITHRISTARDADVVVGDSARARAAWRALPSRASQS